MQLKPILDGFWRSRREEPPLYATIFIEIAEPRQTLGCDELPYSGMTGAITKFLLGDQRRDSSL